MTKTRTRPFGDSGSEAASVSVCRCGAGLHAEHGDRCAAGHVVKGNGLALVTGYRSAAFWEAHAAATDELQAAIIQDAGHTLEDAPRALLLAGDSIAQATLIRDSAFQRMVDSGGPLTSSGRERRAFSVWASALDRVERHLRLIGLERKVQPGPTLTQWMKDRNATQDDEGIAEYIEERKQRAENEAHGIEGA